MCLFILLGYSSSGHGGSSSDPFQAHIYGPLSAILNRVSGAAGVASGVGSLGGRGMNKNLSKEMSAMLKTIQSQVRIFFLFLSCELFSLSLTFKIDGLRKFAEHQRLETEARNTERNSMVFCSFAGKRFKTLS